VSAAEVASQLAATVADLDGYISRRAGELAAPKIAEAIAAAERDVAAAQFEAVRSADLVAEMRRRLSALESGLGRLRADMRRLVEVAGPDNPRVASMASLYGKVGADWYDAVLRWDEVEPYDEVLVDGYLATVTEVRYPPADLDPAAEAVVGVWIVVDGCDRPLAFYRSHLTAVRRPVMPHLNGSRMVAPR
jgi:hypothetical protein